MYGIYANIWGILMVNVTIYTIHGSSGHGIAFQPVTDFAKALLQLFLELQIMDLLQNGPVAPVEVMLCLENGLDALKDGARPDKAVLSLIMCQ